MENTFVNELIRYEQQLRILHWQTRSYARHKAYGDAYVSISELMDTFVELYMGKYGRVEVTTPIELKNIKQLNVVDFLKEATSFLSNMNIEDTDILNVRDEILGEFKKLMYLLTLK